MFESTGVATIEMIKEVFPNEERIKQGPVAIIECYQEIPCNPCATACKRNAIKDFVDINDRPELNTEVCNGCGVCIHNCPGLAIMVVDGSYSEDEVLFKIPYEFLPLPKAGDIVQGLNRAGEYITEVKVIKVMNPNAFDKTPVIHVAVNRAYLYDFKSIRLEDR